MMTGVIVEDHIVGLDRKLDFIVEELKQLRRVRNSAEDLIADLTLVGKDVMKDATEALGSAALRPQEIIHLIKGVLLDANLLNSALQQLESVSDFIQDAQPIARDLFRQAVASCQVAQQKGYFQATAAGMRVGDALVKSHSTKDWEQIETSVPQLVGFLRELTRPEVLQALEAILHGFGKVQATMNVDKSIFELVRDLNSNDARRGMAILVEFLKVVGSRAVLAGAFGIQESQTSGR